MSGSKQKKGKQNNIQNLCTHSAPLLSRIPSKLYLASPEHSTLKFQQSKLFRVKRIHSNTLTINERMYGRDVFKIKKTIKIMKYMRKLHVKAEGILYKRVELAKICRFNSKLRSLELEVSNLMFFVNNTGIGVSQVATIQQMFKGFGLNLTSLVLNICFGYGYENEMIVKFTKQLIQNLRKMSNLKSFIFKSKTKFRKELPYESSPIETEEEKWIKLCQTQFQRLKKIENLQLKCSTPPNTAIDCFDKRFSHLSNLKNLEIISFNDKHGKKLVERIKEVKSLSSLTFSYSIEPNDLLALSRDLPNLRRLEIKDDWIFSSTSLTPANRNNSHVTQLLFDIPLEIENKGDSDFVREFIESFKNLQLLKLYLTCPNEDALPIMKTISSLKSLDSLTLGLLLPPSIINKALDVLKKQAKLKKISLLLRPGYSISWTKDYKATFDSLEAFLFQNKSLGHLEMYWERLTPHCMERFITFFKKLPKLESFKLVYTSPFKEHGTNHDQILKDLEAGLREIKNIQFVTINTSCNVCVFRELKGQRKGINPSIKECKGFNHIVIVPGDLGTPFDGEKLTTSN